MAEPINSEPVGIPNSLFLEHAGAEAPYLRALASIPSCPMTILGVDGTIMSWSTGCRSLFGYSAEEAIGQDFLALLGDYDRSLMALRSQAGRSEAIELGGRLRDKDGRLRDVQVAANTIRRADGGTVGVVAIIHDASMTKEAQRKLHAARHVEGMANVAAGLAHDINGMLTVVTCHARFAADGVLSAKQQEDLSVVVEAASRGAVLTDQLLGVYGKRKPRAVIVELREAIGDVCSIVRRMLGESVIMKTCLPGKPLRVRAAPGQLDRILLNLVINARDAMPTGGILTISARPVVVDTEHPLHGQIRDGSHAVITVRDTGAGMDASTRDRIFESSFTTKADGQGSGLGLAVVREVLSDLRGAIQVESEKAWGTMFSVYLPMVNDSNVEDSIAPLETVEPHGPTTARLLRPSVLIVDDDAILRESLVQILTKQEVEASAATSPRHALRVLRTRAIDVLVTEHVTNGMDVIELLESVREHSPNTACILLTEQISQDVLMAAVNKGRLVRILQRDMPLPAICDEIADVASEMMRS